jgi:NAD(P)-dependent dehydrogenase (short-subunit alcohol dehydrogenase family)
MSSQSLAGTTALVTGAARRLGRATARALAAQGANVVVHYGRSEAEAEALAAELRGGGREAWTLRADFDAPGEIESLIPRALEQAGGLQVLVNNASIFPPGSLAEANLESLTRNIQVNAWAPFELSRSFAEHAKRGAIVNFLDTRVAGYDWKHVEYILSKKMLAALTEMTAVQFAPEITVNAVAPGLILPPPGKDESYLEALADTVPLKRHGEAEDIAEAVLFLVRSDYVTGQVIYVDGGRHLLESGSGPDTD